MGELSARAPFTSAKEAVAWFTDHKWNESRLGLSRVRELIDRLKLSCGDDGTGHGVDAAPCVDTVREISVVSRAKAVRYIHIAGTNGKGSTAAMLSSILLAAGFRTGLYTSPWLRDFNEQIRIDGVPVTDASLVCAAGHVRAAADAMSEHPTEFELITAAALWLFADAGCEFAVLETGMGGRLDATNAIDCPELAVITPISMDHMEYLGATIAEIATEKAGIIKPGCTVCSAPQPLEAERVLRAHCTKVGSILSFARPQALERLGQDAHGQWLRHRPEMDGGDHGGNVGHDRSVRSDGSGGNGGSARLFLPLIGSHQIANAALALACVRTLRERGIRIDPEAVRDGLARTQWSGRMELVAETPAPIFLDGAHNVAGVQSAVDTLAELYGEKRILFVFGALKDKDVAGMRKVLEPRAKRIIRVTPNSSRAEDAGKTLAEGLAEALRCAGQDDIVCILGSLYLQKEDLQAFSTEPPPAPPAPTSPAAVLE